MPISPQALIVICDVIYDPLYQNGTRGQTVLYEVLLHTQRPNELQLSSRSRRLPRRDTWGIRLPGPWHFLFLSLSGWAGLSSLLSVDHFVHMQVSRNL